ncbi:phage integrase SAM-like domain-containing protein [Chitinophaga lutea]
MMLPIKPVCKKNFTRKDGTSIVFIQYCYSVTRRTLVDSGIAIPPDYWNRKRLRIADDLPAGYGNAAELNQRLQNALRIAQDIVNHALQEKLPDPLGFLKKNFSPEFDPETLHQKAQQELAADPAVNLDLLFQVDDYMKCKANKVTPGMMKVFKNMKDHLAAFQVHRGKAITFASFDFNFYEAFVDFLTHEYIQRRRKTEIKGLKTATVGKTIKQLRIFLRDRMRRKIIQPIDLSDFKILDEESDAIYLSTVEIMRIYALDLAEAPHLAPYRDLFVLGCLTGLRFSDFSTIRPEDLKKGMLHKKQDKSDHWVVIPLRAVAEEILVKRFNRRIPVVCNVMFNRQIKEVAKLAGITDLVRFSHKQGNKNIVTVRPKYAWVTSHTCRRSFCTNEFLAGTPAELIMRISGHKSLRDFYRYIRITPEEAGRKIREIWEKRGELTALAN